MTGIAITFMIKNKKSKNNKILYYDIGNNLEKEKKLLKLRNFKSIRSIIEKKKFKIINPDEDNDWINQGNKKFKNFFKLVEKDKNISRVFNLNSPGISTNRDAWVYNFSKENLKNNVKRLLNNYNQILNSEIPHNKIDKNSKEISWTRGLLNSYKKNIIAQFNEANIINVSYRPFIKQNLYYDKMFIESPGRKNEFFPNNNENNELITINGLGSRNGFSCLMINNFADLNFHEAGAQCFPLYFYEQNELNIGLFTNNAENNYIKSDGLNEKFFNHFIKKYKLKKFNKKDLFHYIYGILHSSDYRKTFSNNLTKQLARLPLIKNANDVLKFSTAGKKLAELHLNYENVKPYPITFKEGDLRLANIDNPKVFYHVEKMKYGKLKGKEDKSVIKYNNNLTLINIPLEAYNYIVNGRSPIEWVMERQIVKKDKTTGIINNCNDYANETMNNPAYPLELLQRVITVSLKTNEIVNSLPNLELD